MAVVSVPRDGASSSHFTNKLSAWAARFTSEHNDKMVIIGSTEACSLAACEALVVAGYGDLTRHAALNPSQATSETWGSMHERPAGGG